MEGQFTHGSGNSWVVAESTLARLFSKACLVASISVAIAGCGGGGIETTPSRLQFSQEAGRICAAAKTEREMAPKGRYSHSDLEEYLYEQVVSPLEGMLEKFSELPVPLGDKPTVERIYNELQQGVERLRADPQSALRRDVFGAANRASRAYGLPECVI